mmetsp:Transcript_25605/g.34068  ORF Transcript_25605/g.34068 Transcript_25605/m.34068 type:complete len:425 (-) Transcript_25605:195-1469(-)
MKFFLNALSLISLSIFPTNVISHGSHDELKWDHGNITMPYPLSDMTATTFEEKFIVIVGGCNNEDGNVYVSDPDYGEFFACFSITDEVLKFSPSDGTFSKLKSAPRKRYRHAAVAIGNNLWVVGGRDEMDNIIGEIDVYNIETDMWSTPISLPPNYLTSDNAAFTDSSGDKLFVTGGWEANYVALDTTIAIDIGEALNGVVSIEEKAKLNYARGDIYAASTDDYSLSYVTGGFTDKNVYCAPLSSAERYNVEFDRWEPVNSMRTGRGDKAIVELNNRIFAVGGERKLEEVCDETKQDELPHLGDQSVPVDDAEVLDPSDGIDAEWRVIDDLPHFRFRFTAAAWDETDTIYTFGGQKMYDTDCNCFATSDAVVTYIDEQFEDDDDGRLATGAVVGIVVGVIVGVSVLAVCAHKIFCQKNDIEYEN